MENVSVPRIKTLCSILPLPPCSLSSCWLSCCFSLIQKGVNTILKEKYDQQKTIHIDDIITAANNDDNLSIELIEEAGEKVGKAVAFLINTFNPETVIVGGNLAAAGDYIMLPLKSATNKYSLNLVYKDTKFRVSKMTENANAWGVAMLIRNKIIGL